MNLQPIQLSDYDRERTECIRFLAMDTRFSAVSVYDSLSLMDTVFAAHATLNPLKSALIFDDTSLSAVHKYITGRKDALKQTINLQRLFHPMLDIYPGGAPGASLGFATQYALSTDKRMFIIVEDHALSYGGFYEGLVELNRIQPNVTLVVVDELDTLLRHYNSPQRLIKSIRISRPYTQLKHMIKTNQVSKHLVSPLSKIRDSVKEGVVESSIFSHFNINSIGPIDGDNIKDLVRAFQISEDSIGPNVIHVRTRTLQKDLKTIKLPAFKTDFTKPTGYRSTLQTLDIALIEYGPIHVFHDIAGDLEVLTEYESQYPAFYHTSYGVTTALINRAFELAQAGEPVVIIIDSNGLFDSYQRFINAQRLPITLILKQSGLQALAENGHHVYDALASHIPTYMGKDNQEMVSILNYILRKEHGLQVLRIHQNNELTGDLSLVKSDTWTQEVELEVEAVCIVLSYGPSVSSLVRRVQGNQLPIEIINCSLINTIDDSLLDYLLSKQCEIRVYDVENVHRPLLSALQDKIMSRQVTMRIRSFDITSADLTLNSKDIKTRNGLHIEHVLTLDEGVDERVN